MVVPIAIYLVINFGRSSASGWGTAMSTHTAFALGALALVGPGVPDRVRTYLLTFALADDVAGIVVIALAYSGHIDLAALAAGVAILGAVMVARWRGIRNGPAYLLLGVAAWVAFFESGVDPVVVGLAVGLLAVAYPAARSDLEQASESFRQFREQPVPELARDARESVRLAISPNDRLQQLFHPWTVGDATCPEHPVGYSQGAEVSMDVMAAVAEGLAVSGADGRSAARSRAWTTRSPQARRAPRSPGNVCSYPEDAELRHPVALGTQAAVRT
jgi:hypothetical protein